MEFYFASFSDFMWMEGHGPYVWVSYALTIIVFIGMALGPKLRKSKFVQQQRALAARNEAAVEVANNEPR